MSCKQVGAVACRDPRAPCPVSRFRRHTGGARRCALAALWLAASVHGAAAVADDATTPPPTPAGMPAGPAALRGDDLERFVGSVVEQQLQRRQIAGAVVVIVKDGNVRLSRGYGFADVGKRVPMTADTTLVRAGSISKLLTVVAVMQLVEQGRLDLDRDVSGYLDFAVPTPAGGVPVTLRMLLTHRAGFEMHIKDLFGAGSRPEPLGIWLRRSLPRRLYPGSDVPAYSNYGYGLAGYVVERVAGQRFEDYAATRILGPLRMDSSTFEQPPPPRLASLMSRAYRRSTASPLPYIETVVPAPAGGLSATAVDLGRFMRALLGGGGLDGGHVLRPLTLVQLLSPPQSGDPLHRSLLGFEQDVAAGNRFIGKHARTTAVVSELALLPEAHFGLFVSYNSAGAAGPPDAPTELLDALAQRYFKRPATPWKPLATDAVDSRAVAGAYQSTMRADSTFVRLSALLQQLIVAAAPGTGIRIDALPDTLHEAEPLVFRGGGDLRASFARRESGGMSMQLSLMPLAVEWHRVAWYLDARFVRPAVGASVAVIALTMLLWPVAAAARRRRAAHFGTSPRDAREHRWVRLALALYLLALAGAAGVAAVAADLTRLNASFDPVLVLLYAVAWLAVLAAPLATWIAVRFWRDRVGTGWARIHQSLIAVATAMVAWFFVVWEIAGTTLVY